MSSLSRNVVANLFGRAWTSLIAIALTPIYIGILGIEAYGLIGAYVVLQTIFMIFDLGLGLTLNRQLSSLSAARETNAQLMRDTVRTFERIYVVVGALLAATLVVTAPLLARAWFHTSRLSVGDTTVAIAMMGIAVGMQWASALYLGGLLGLERQVRANVTLSVSASVRGLGAIAVLQLVSPTIAAFFFWQVIVGGLQTITLRHQLLQSLPLGTARDKFRPSILWKNVRFAGALTGITALGILVTQLDKVVISALVPLGEFGYYALAATVTSGLYIFVVPVFNAAFPQLVAALGRGEDIGHTYHRACQIASVLLLPPAMTLIVFAPEALFAWLGDATQSQATVWLVRFLATGTALNGLVNLPYALMLAAGWTRLPLAMNVIAVATLVPLLVLLVSSFGTIGGATAWLIYNLGIVFVGVPIMHRRLLRGDAIRWYVTDVGWPLLGATGAAALVRVVFGEPTSRLGMFLLVFGAICACVLGAWLFTPARVSLIRGLAQLFRGRTRSSAEP